ncbi:MAG: hypothetical protein ABJE66_07700 [Deltaproteobacteria bacterium]
MTSIDGTIAAGHKLALRVPAAPKRVFKPKVVELEANKKMVWVEGAAPMFRGVRTFTLAPRPGATAPSYFILVEFVDGKVDSIRDFRYVPYIATEAPYEPA